MARTQQSPARNSRLIIRLGLFVALALVVICAILWFSLKRNLNRGIALYEAGKYQEAADVLEPLLRTPMARLRIQGAARWTFGLCKAELATEVAMKERSAEGYRKALQLLAEAEELAGPTQAIEQGIKEYTEYLQKAEHPDAVPVVPPGPPGAPAAPPTTPR